MLDRRPRRDDRLLRRVAPAAPRDSSAGCAGWRGANCGVARLPTALSEWVPGRVIGVFEVADIGPEPRPDAGADRRELQLLVGLKIDPEPADHVGRSLDADEMVENLRRCLDVVDENEGSRAVAADVEADGRALPIDLLLPAILEIEHALAIAQTAHEGAGRFLADDVAAWPPGPLEHIFDCLRHTLGCIAEKGVAGLHHLLERIGRWLGCRALIIGSERLDWLRHCDNEAQQGGRDPSG